MTTPNSGDPVLDEVVAMLVEVAGDDILLEGEVTRDTTFSEDLALESIEFVALAEKLQQRYGESVDLVAFMADMDINEIMAMTVGQLVSHIEQRTGAAQPTVTGPAG